MTRPKTTMAIESASQDKATTLDVRKIASDVEKSQDRVKSDLAVNGLVSNARTLMSFAKSGFGAMSPTDTVVSIGVVANQIHGGDLSAAETMLTAQAIVLDSVFGELARRAALNMSENLVATETYMKLALKAQSQCRATLVALAEIKNPPVVFARQLNVANGPQQVNNAAAPDTGTASRPRAPAGQISAQQTELLEHRHGNCLDTRAQGSTSSADPLLAAMGAVHRPAQS